MTVGSTKLHMFWIFCLALVSTTAGYLGSRFDPRYSPCSESLPESQRLRRNCSPLKPMLLHYLKKSVCNDGSVAGYYLRRRSGSTNWLIYLEGGGYCVNKETCAERLIMSKSKKFSLVSIRGSSKKKFVTGILSTQLKTNPLWWNSNHVYIPYCSSDIWTGNKTADKKGGFSFLGARIIDEVVSDLYVNRGLDKGTNLTLAGSSAGGTGVMLNIDRVADNLKEKGSKIKVQGIVDSGWFLDNDLIKSLNCGLPNGHCKPSDVIKAAMKFWHADLPARCISGKSVDKHHLCLFGDKLYPTLKSPIFVIQWIYDLAQIKEDNPELESSLRMLMRKQYGPYMAYLGKRVRESLNIVKHFFAPSCLGHTILTREQWLGTRVGPRTLFGALECWLLKKRSSCQFTDKCQMPHCSDSCPYKIETHNGDIPIRRITGDFSL
ncbi:palmitoleoyl-protein carboxylesterase NOTUM-like [Rhopilema esculentum]|uniref:palmitoleoyl-protein carboxylesterase NOTUM-like n=1 Tax=Rhopilema esculentum TaxID=499914 RepID=UPI0031D9904A